jgi:hypothetical protein
MNKMTDEAIIEELKRQRSAMSPLGLALKLQQLYGSEISHGLIVTFFKRAFPEIPLRALLDVGAWSRVGEGKMTDEEFERLLSPWLGTVGTADRASRQG